MYSNISSPDHPGRLQLISGDIEKDRKNSLPIVIVLLTPTHAQGPVDARGTAQKLAPAEFDLSPVDAGHGHRHQVPVRVRVEILGPAADHVHVFELAVVRPGLDQEDAHVAVVFGQSARHHATGRAAAATEDSRAGSARCG